MIGTPRTPVSLPTLHAAAETMLTRRWMPIPLRPDGNKLPKVPMVDGWSFMDWAETDIASFPWAQAAGIGIVLGLPSNCLVVLDIDVQQIFDDTLAALGDDAPRAVRTARNRGHLYFQETKELSTSGWHEITWKGEKVRIELKATGTQVAAPPTPGYRLLNSAPPMKVPSIEAAWSWVMFYFRKRWGEVPHLVTPDPCTGNGRYPKPWRERVPEGERDNTAYVEAHKLREAGASLEQTLDFMQQRFHTAYDQQGIEWSEIKCTIESAYRKGSTQPASETRRYDDEFALL